jgi:serine/threonine protein kinase/Tfp pilus assembly protein PilF
MPGVGRHRWKSLSPYLDRALELGGPERAAFLEVLRAQDPTLADDLLDLLRERTALSREGFLEGAVDLPPSAAASMAGQTVGAYTLVSLIGQGGMGGVWLARRSDGRFEGEAAVKLLNASLIGHAGEDRFRREGSILARLTHPHIARLVDAGVSGTGQPYLVLEHVAGEHIDHYCNARALDVDARLRLFLDVLAAVAHAHANLIVHRDIKPSNVLVGSDGQVKLLDFGIAKLIEGETAGAPTALTRDGGRALTPEYAAPEQVTGGLITIATDVYALGALLYLLLTGRHPAGAALRSPADLLRAIVEVDPPRPSDTAADLRARRRLRGDLDTIVAKALKKRPEERYASVTALADDIRRHLDEQPIGARPDTFAYRSAKFLRRHARGVAMAGAAALLLAGLVAFYTARLAAERDRARLEAEKAAKVSGLLSGLLSGADPYATREDKEPTVRGLLDAAAARLPKELAGEPEVQAEMLTVIGRVYQRLGANDKAQPLLEQALAVGRRVEGPQSERVAETLNDLGVLRRERGDYAGAAPMLEEALAMRRKLLGREHKDVAVTLVELGRAYCDQGSDERAEPLFREALAIRRKVLGEDDHETATSEGDLASVLWRKGDLAAAESLYRHDLAVYRKVSGNDSPDVASTLNNLALIAGDQHDFAGAESLFRESLAISRKTLGDAHPNIANTLNNLAYALREQGKTDEAAAMLEEALRIALPSLGDEHPQIATYRINLARVYLARNQAAAAEPLLRRSLRVRRRTFREDDWRVGVAKSLLGADLTALGRYGEAEGLLNEAQRVLRDVPGLQGREAVATRVRLAALYDAWGRPQEAALYRPAAGPR